MGVEQNIELVVSTGLHRERYGWYAKVFTSVPDSTKACQAAGTTTKVISRLYS